MERKQHLQKLLSQAVKEYKDAKNVCLVSDCKNFAINSHSQQKSRQLTSIAENNQVYHVTNNDVKLSHISNIECFEKINIRKASTFPGFCENHDKNLFEQIDNETLDKNNKKHTALVFYRSLCYELSKKMKYKKIFSRMSELLHQNNYFNEAIEYENIAKSKDMAITNDLQPLIEKTSLLLENEKQSNIKTIWRTVDINLGTSCSCIFCPVKPEKYLDIFSEDCHKIQPTASFNIIPLQNKTHIVTSWYCENNNKHYSQLRREMRNEFIKTTNRILFTETEDFCFNPSLWENIASETKENIKSLLSSPYAQEPIPCIWTLNKKKN